MVSRRWSLASTVGCILFVAACGSGDDDGSSAPSSPTPETAGKATSVAEPASTPTVSGGSTATASSGGGAASTASAATGGPAPEEEFVDVFATNYALFADAEQDACVGQTLVNAVGYDQLAASGILPDDVLGIVTLAEIGLTVEQEALPAAIEQLDECGDLATQSLEGGSGTEEQTACAAEIVTDPLTAEQLMVQLTGLAPSAELLEAREALEACQSE